MAAGRGEFTPFSVRGGEARGSVESSATQTDSHFKPGHVETVSETTQGDRRAGRGRGAELQSVSTENHQSRGDAKHDTCFPNTASSFMPKDLTKLHTKTRDKTSIFSFLVMFSAVIESGSNAKLCASLLKPNESLAMTIFLVDDQNQTRPLAQQSSSDAFHRCFSFQAPKVDGELVQKVRVVLQGRFFKMTEERKVMFRSYLPLTFIQTDKPIYNPGQMGELQMTLLLILEVIRTCSVMDFVHLQVHYVIQVSCFSSAVNFRVLTMDAKFVPLNQMVKPVLLLVFQDFK